MVIKLVFFVEASGAVPLLEWLDTVTERALVKCYNRLDRLREHGHMLRRPEADYLRNGIYELRVRDMKLNYRILYFFHGQAVAIISHGLIKEDVVPAIEIDKALRRLKLFKLNPTKHSLRG